MRPTTQPDPDRAGIFAGSDPIEIARRWLGEAWTSESGDANAMQLATVDADGMPDVRTVLLKEIGPDGFAFYTNYESAKARQIDATGAAAFVLHWKSLSRQVRARGRIARADAARSDAYYLTRGVGSRIGAWASPQSRPIADRAELERLAAQARARHGDDPPRPPHWGGFVIEPVQMELWADGADRLHDRFRFERDGKEWRVQRLGP